MTTSSDLLFLNEIIVPIRWVDIDAYGHLNNSRYFDAMTEVRAHYILPIAHLAPDCQFVLIHTDCNFKKPYYYPGQIRIQQFLKNLGKTSIELNYLFYNNTPPLTKLSNEQTEAQYDDQHTLSKEIEKSPSPCKNKLFSQSSENKTLESGIALPMMEKHDAVLHAEGHATIVCFDARNKKTIKIPESIREQLTINKS